MKAKRPARGNASKKKSQTRVGGAAAREAKRLVDAPPHRRKPARDARPQRSAPQTSPIRRPVDVPARPKSSSQAKARAKARKAKAPKVVRPPLRQRILVRIASIELNPRTLVARVPFVVLIIAALGTGLGVTLWLSTDAAERSYQLGNARQVNQALMQQKEGLERDVLEAQAAPALAEAARNLGMIPSRDTAHLVQDAAGNWVVVGTPKPAEGVPPPPLNAPLPDPVPAAPPAPRVVEPREVPVRIPPVTGELVLPQSLPGAIPPGGAEVPVGVAPGMVPPAALGVDPATVPPVPLGVAPAGEVPHALSGESPTPGPVPLLAPETPGAVVSSPADQFAAPPIVAPPIVAPPVVAPPPAPEEFSHVAVQAPGAP
ncbi:MAG: hypothetical protein U1D00_22915, partial [Mycobacterium sp.]|nr:hypothetical protein [Mycobacterium sp.]